MNSESQNIEYKESWNDKYLEWICGFANAQGGKIYIGVNDDREVVGVDDSKKLMEDIPNKIVNQLGIVCDVNLLQESGKEFIEIVVQPSPMPISCHGKYHYRSGSTKQELNGASLQQFIMKKVNLTWESLTHDNASLNDISEEAVRFFQRQAVNNGRLPNSCLNEDVEQTLRRLHVISPDGKLTMAALVLFGRDIEQWCPSAIFRIGRFGSSDADLISSDDISCPLVMMPENIMQILRSKYLVSPIRYEGMQRREPLEIPADALREMLCNSIIHKDYQKTFIQMKVWDDHITLWNPGPLPEGFTVDTLMESHESNPRNNLIARTFYLLGYIENWGRGYEKIVEGFTNAKLSLPTFEEVRGGLMATIKREKFMSHVEKPVNIRFIKDFIKERGVELTERQQEILHLLRENPELTSQKISQKISQINSASARTIIKDMKVLQEVGLLQRVGSKKEGHWEVIVPDAIIEVFD